MAGNLPMKQRQRKVTLSSPQYCSDKADLTPPTPLPYQGMGEQYSPLLAGEVNRAVLILPQQPNAYGKSVFMQEYRKATATGGALTRTTGVAQRPGNAIAAGFE